MSSHDSPAWSTAVLDFWFGELEPRDWFMRSDALDDAIRSRFLAIHERVVATNAREAVGASPALAAVIVLDQFSRNMFRNDPRAFAADPLARQLASQAIDAGFDIQVSPAQRLFFYLPFEHSESLEDQARSVALISSLTDKNLTRYARAHQSLIERFGRFPHRNAVLGQESTAAELEALKGPMASF